MEWSMCNRTRQHLYLSDSKPWHNGYCVVHSSHCSVPNLGCFMMFYLHTAHGAQHIMTTWWTHFQVVRLTPLH